MSFAENRTEFARIILTEAAPDELEFLDAYERGAEEARSGKPLGTGFGIEQGALVFGPLAVMIAHKAFDKLLEWGIDVAGKTVEKFLVDQGVDGLKKFLDDPVKRNLAGVITESGKKELLKIVERQAKEAALDAEDIVKMKRIFIKSLGLT
jgi:hypothetical protein